MYRHVFRTLARAVAVAVLMATVGAAQGLQTGEITGRVSTQDGLSLPGATITVRGAALQGTRTAVTDANGNYVVRALPPGAYEVTIEMASMATRTEKVTVEVSRQATLDTTLSLASVTEAITVKAETGTETLASPTVGANYDAREINILPTGRTPFNIAELAPGLTSNTPNNGQVTISGGFAYDNIFMINGVDVNDNLFGSANNLFIEDAIEQTSVLASGISAEFGRFSGGIINMVTKSGGNDFAGSFRANFTNDAWTRETPRERTANINRTDKLNQNYEWTFGGPFVRDRAWFFTAGRWQENDLEQTLPTTNLPFTQTTKSNRFEVKGTGTIRAGHTLVGNYIRNSVTQTRVPFAFTIDPFIPENLKPDNDLIVGSYNGVLGGRAFLNVQASRKYNALIGQGGSDTNIFASPILTRGGGGVPVQLHYNGNYFDATDPEERNNNQVSGSLAYFLTTSSFGTHDLKTGADYYTTSRTGGNSQSATNYVFLANYLLAANGGPAFDAAGRIIPVFTPNFSAVQNWIATRGAEIDVKTLALFLQDNWAVNRRLTVNAGLRMENANSHATGDIDAVKATVWTPRLAATWNVDGSGQTIVQASYAHYAGKVSELQAGRNSVVGNPAVLQLRYTGPAGQGRDFAPGFDIANYTLLEGANFPSANVFQDDDLRAPVTREFSASIGRQLWNRGMAKVTYVNRSYTDLIEDFFDDPTASGRTSVDAAGRTLVLDNRIFRNSDLPTREYQAMLFQANYRPLNRLHIEGHYTLQIRNHGNFEGEAANQPGIGSSVGDYPEILVAERNFPEGRLNDFQRHKLRLWALWSQGLGRFGTLDIAPLVRIDSGTTYSLAAASVPLSSVQLSRNPGYAQLPGGGLQTLFFGERGSETFPSFALMDLGFTYTIPVVGTVRPWIKAEILNVTNNQKVIAFNTTVTPDPNSPLDANGLPTGFIRGPQFGQPTSNAHYPLWRPGFTGGRTYLVAAGIRF
jgi:hypothetical protein